MRGALLAALGLLLLAGLSAPRLLAARQPEGVAALVLAAVIGLATLVVAAVAEWREARRGRKGRG